MWVRKTAEDFKKEKTPLNSIKSAGTNLLVAIAVTTFALIWDQSFQYIMTCFILSLGASIFGSIFFDDPFLLVGFIFSGQASPSGINNICPKCYKLVERTSDVECECGAAIHGD